LPEDRSGKRFTDAGHSLTGAGATVMNRRLLFPLLLIAALVIGIGWAEYTSWREVAGLKRQLDSPALARVIAQSEKWPADDQAAFQDLIAEVRSSVNAFRGWLVASCIGVLVLAGVLARTIQREMIAPLENRLVESHAVIARQEKLASLGVLAAGVAHEIRNPLTAIKARLFSQRRKLSRDSAEHADAVFINDEINRLEQIVRDFLQFARPAEPSLASVETSALLQAVHELMAPEIKAREIDLRLDTPHPLTARMDAAQIRQVLLNLIRNAADSIERDGIITLRTRPTYLPFAPRRVPAVAIEVEDTGPGIPAEVRERLFDPFFTTKESGTGLGLAIAERIVHAHKGSLQFHTKTQHGAIFSVILPSGENP
jgi:signal transduction histidine kinase